MCFEKSFFSFVIVGDTITRAICAVSPWRPYHEFPEAAPPGQRLLSLAGAAMSAKAPYYYSELGPDKSPVGAPPPPDEPPAGLNGGTPPPGSSASESAAADTSPVGDQGGGFFNPLLSIEPDVSVPDTSPKRGTGGGNNNNKKKKKAKKKGGSPSKSNGIYGTTTAYARQLLFGSSKSNNGTDKKNRRGSEPNIYEEITDAEEQYSAARSEQCLRAGGAPTIPRRPRPPPYDGAPPHVREEVTRVHRTHAHILENLNLDVETMLMPDAVPLSEVRGGGDQQQRGSSGDYGTLGTKLGRPIGDPHHHHPHTTWRRVMNEYVEHRSAPGELQGGTLPARASKLHRIPYASHKSELQSRFLIRRVN